MGRAQAERQTQTEPDCVCVRSETDVRPRPPARAREPRRAGARPLLPRNRAVRPFTYGRYFDVVRSLSPATVVRVDCPLSRRTHGRTYAYASLAASTVARYRASPHDPTHTAPHTALLLRRLTRKKFGGRGPALLMRLTHVLIRLLTDQRCCSTRTHAQMAQ